MVTLPSSKADTKHPHYLNSVLGLGLFTTSCNDAVVLARSQAVATASHILRVFLRPSVFRLKHVPIYWTGDREKLGQEQDRSTLAPLWVLSAVLDQVRRHTPESEGDCDGFGQCRDPRLL